MPDSLTERAFPGVHAEVHSYLIHRFPPPRRLLDLASGTGAFLLRCKESGYTDLYACELNTDGYHGPVPALTIDLNQPFADRFSGLFDIITAIELIEHLENPSQFLRQCAMLLAPGGAMLFTSPNIEGLQSRLRFLKDGMLREFNESGDPTHISPIHSYVLAKMADRAGLKVLERAALRSNWGLSRWWMSMICRGLQPFTTGLTRGYCNLFVLEKQGT